MVTQLIPTALKILKPLEPLKVPKTLNLLKILVPTKTSNLVRLVQTVVIYLTHYSQESHIKKHFGFGLISGLIPWGTHIVFSVFIATFVKKLFMINTLGLLPWQGT